jgi:hypothetical protein
MRPKTQTLVDDRIIITRITDFLLFFFFWKLRTLALL